MKRTRELTTNELKYRKLGGGSLRLLGRIIKPGEIFYADPDDLPASFADVLECLDGVQGRPTKGKSKVADIGEVVVPDSVYTLQLNEAKSTEDEPLYDIVNEAGKVINEQPLNKVQAEETIKALA